MYEMERSEQILTVGCCRYEHKSVTIGEEFAFDYYKNSIEPLTFHLCIPPSKGGSTFLGLFVWPIGALP